MMVISGGGNSILTVEDVLLIGRSPDERGRVLLHGSVLLGQLRWKGGARAVSDATASRNAEYNTNHKQEKRDKDDDERSCFNLRV